LEELEIRELPAVSEFTWFNFSRVLSNPQSALKWLSIYSHTFTDTVVAAFAQALTRNSTLECFDIIPAIPTFPPAFSPAGFLMLQMVLCDTTNVNATIHSNHTLSDVGDLPSVVESFQLLDVEVGVVAALRNIQNLLEMNEEEDKQMVARKKIIKYHFAGGAFDLDTNQALTDDSLVRQR
jgi:hypothetical protein